MAGRDRTDAGRVWRAVSWLSAQPRGGVAVRVWALLEAIADPGSGKIDQDRTWIAKACGTTVQQVSRVYAMLVRCNAVRRVRSGVDGRQVEIYLNRNYQFPLHSSVPPVARNRVERR